MGLGASTSGGIYYGNDLLFNASPISLGLSGPYSQNVEDMIHGQPFTFQTAYAVPAPMPYERCHMFKRSFDLCKEREYTYDSYENRCIVEKEDYHNCYLHGKEHRFSTIWNNVHKTEAGERQLSSFYNNWEKSMYDKDQGDVLLRAENIRKMYEERGLKGPKFQGGWE